MSDTFDRLKITDGIVTLRPFQLRDAEEHLRGEDDDQRRWLSGGTSTLASVKKWIEKNAAFWEHGGPVFAFAVVLSSTNQLIGMVEANLDYNNLEGLNPGDANISYSVYPQFRRLGYAAISVNLLLGFIQKRGVRRATIRIKPDNSISLKIPEKCGFKRSGELITSEGHHLFFVKQLG